jgi:hypothetical protein
LIFSAPIYAYLGGAYYWDRTAGDSDERMHDCMYTYMPVLLWMHP